MTTALELQHFAILDISYSYTATSVIITVTTNNPCHLTVYYTDKPPVRHITSRVLRGLALPWGAYWCFVGWNSVEQHEDGDTLIHTFEIPNWLYCQTKWVAFRGITQPGAAPPTGSELEAIAKVYEPWGETLTENYPWLPYTIPNIPEFDLQNGILTMTNPGYADCGLAYGPPYLLLPILNPDNEPLRISLDNPDVSINSSSTQIHHELIFRSLTEVMSIYLAIALGAEWDYYKPQHHTVISGRDCGIFYIGPGYHDIDLHKLFVKFRNEFGKSPDPTGWWLNDIVFVMSLGEEHRTDYLKSDYIAFYHHLPFEDTPSASPSASPLLKHHHPGVLTTVNLGVSQKAYYRYAMSANPGDPDLLYNEAHDKEQALSYWEGVIQYGQRVRVIGTYAYVMIRRTAILFNTGALPPCTLLQAVLRLDIRKVTPPSGYSANWDWYLKVRAGQDLNTQITHPELINYSNILALGTQIGAKYADDLPDPGYQDYWYIGVPLEYINLDGFTVITSLTGKDETKTRPANNTIEEALFIANSFSMLHIAYYKH